ncbi:hypothetical protein LINGRAHAP2_LOCUS33595 [Linum grandiflorum]
MNILSWNVRGACIDSFSRVLKDIVRSQQVDFALLFENKVQPQRAAEVVESLPFVHSVVVDSVGRAGGIWALWNEHNFTVSVIAQDSHAIHLLVSSQAKGNWVLSGCYASPNRVLRETLWSRLVDFYASNQLPWVLLYDFNEIANTS